MKPEADRIVADAEFTLTASDFKTLADVLFSEAGISLSSEKVNLVYSRLAKRLRALRLPDFRAYCQLVTSADGAAERGEMIAALTTNVTRFFREPHHFDHLRTQVLPPLIEQAKRGARLRFWSAACSSGQEPYSMAMTILSAMPDAARYDIKILATDIDPNMIRQGKAGVYPVASLDTVAPALLSRFFVRQGEDQMEVGRDLRALVSFKKLNLNGDWPMSGKFQSIFCRNVVIYFNAETQARIWQRFVPFLDPGGVLYIGHSERVTGPAEQMFKSDGITTYRLLSSAARRP
ncbi:CheR family methyltransferase [Acidisoma sp. C75]